MTKTPASGEQHFPTTVILGEEMALWRRHLEAAGAAAKASGYSEKLVFCGDFPADWEALGKAAEPALFGGKKILQLLLCKEPVKREMEALTKVAKAAGNNYLLVIAIWLRDNRRVVKKAWVKKISGLGKLVLAAKMPAGNWSRYLANYAAELGSVADRSAIEVILHRCQGNLLAATQLIDMAAAASQEAGGEKMAQSPIDRELLTGADNSKYSVFDLVNFALLGNLDKCRLIVDKMRPGKGELPLLVWALERDVAALAQAIPRAGANAFSGLDYLSQISPFSS